MVFLRYILIFLIGYLIIRAFMRYEKEVKASSGKSVSEKKDKVPVKKVSKEIGEYIDYEEIKK
jgi:hypothetical protein